MFRAPVASLLAKPPPLAIGMERPDRYRVVLNAMITEWWVLFGAWAAAGAVVAMLGLPLLAAGTTVLGMAADGAFQTRLRKRWQEIDGADEAEGLNGLWPIVLLRFTLGVLGPTAAALLHPTTPTVAVVLLMQAWSICVAMAQFSAAPRLFHLAIAPPLVAVAISLSPHLSGEAGPALVGAMLLLVGILFLIGRQVGQVWTAWTAACGDNARLIQELVAARATAEAASNAKSTFLATMSHEVRTPLNGVLGMTQVMALHPLDRDQRERVEIIRRSGESLMATLNAVLDLSKIEAGRLELADDVLHPDRLLRDCAAAFAAAAQIKGLDLSARVGSGADRPLSGDPVRVRQIVDNLVGNALKFTDFGYVELAVERIADRLVFSVTDTGAGVAPGDLERIFRPFEQADGSATREHAGSGLGLAICRELAQLMSGEVQADSAPGLGSRFRLSLPAIAAPEVAAPEARPNQTALVAFQALVAEDNATNRIVIRSLLEHLGAVCVMAEDGQAALEALATHAVDLILMDVQMPVMDGLQATRAIRAGRAGSANAHLPIVGLTGNAMAHQVSECLAAGMDEVAAKPIELAVLVAAIERALAPERRRRAG